MMHSTRSAQAAHDPQRFTRAFTLIELIVAIGAIALIAVGIAAIFESIGRTVAGGRRVNQLNQYAALIERQMRSDFESMTREGVLVIKHDYADVDGDDAIDLTGTTDYVLNSPLQRADEGRLRRIDQLLFFTRGEYTSARAPLVPGFNATSNEAMIWYGHGIRLDPIEDVVGRNIGGGAVRYDLPQVSDGGIYRPFPEERALGFTESAYTTNPNRYAENWSLLRKVVLLGQPNSADLNLTPVTDTAYWNDIGFDRVVALDGRIQLGTQPAASSVFSHLATYQDGANFTAPFIRGFRNGDQDRSPVLSSGLVDAATTDLAEIRRIIMDANEYPWNVWDDPTYLDPLDPNYVLDDQYNANLNLTDVTNDLPRMQAWMDDLLPVITDTRSPLANPRGIRPRFEDTMPDYVGTLSLYTDKRTRNYPQIQNFRLTDQRMLNNSVFVPRCTEFIVEYSFGETVADDTSPFYGQLIWHGLARRAQNSTNTEYVVEPYPYWTDPATATAYVTPHNVTYRKFDGTPVSRTLSPIMVYGRTGTRPQFDNAESLTAHFGYNDPTYSPSTAGEDPETIPWPWPKLIRITMTLADPVDPAIEQTFQFVFETPEGRAF